MEGKYTENSIELGVSIFAGRGSMSRVLKLFFYSHIPFLLKNCEVSCKKIYIYKE